MAIKRGNRSWIAAALTLAALTVSLGCERNVRLSGKKIRSTTVGPVTHYGITLDEEASPEQTAFVLLRALRDDFLAPDDAAREAALDVQFDVCAANVIADSNPTSIGRDEFIHQMVHQWTPTVSHYVDDLETEWEEAKPRFVRTGPNPAGNGKEGVLECQILLELDEPGGEPGARVVLVVGLIQDTGLWRVLRVGFTPSTRSLGSFYGTRSQDAKPAGD
ncbi:MAG: hypothetical protein JSU63_20315 [Phycisphaerales bacterium]|nr:MAG: hypothetical protein JSU63_20315 [Phycisphaerales bacterium]